jgi:hypothetical protein
MASLLRAAILSPLRSRREAGTLQSAQRGNEDGHQFQADDNGSRATLPCRIKLGVPMGGLGRLITEMQAWLDENCGADGWAMTPAGLRGVINDAVAVYFLDAALTSAFVARWCLGSNAEMAEGAFIVRSDAPTSAGRGRAGRSGGTPQAVA